MPKTNRLCGSVAVSLCLAAPGFAETIIVDDQSQAALQAALDGAAASPEESVIVIGQTGARIALTDGLRYQANSGLTMFGNGVVLASTGNVTLLSVVDAGAVRLADITLEGPGGWSVENRGDQQGDAGKGLFIDIAEDATGEVGIFLESISVTGVAGHGIHISDCAMADACGNGEDGDNEGSAAGIALVLRDVDIAQAGTGRFDSDGLRVDERGPGSITLHAMFVTVSGVGADGIELDEGQAGDVDVHIIDARFTENGAYCDPGLLAAFLPDTSEAAFEEGSTMDADIPGPVAESPDDACFERDVDYHADGSVEEYEFAIDVDDGFDIDEAGPGSIYAVVSDAVMSGNLDQGFDVDEDGPGDIHVNFSNIFAGGNTDDAFKLSEEDGGDVIVAMSLVEAVGNGGIGIVAEEAGDGDLSMVLTDISTVGNDGGNRGIEAVQEDDGVGIIYLIDSEVADGIDTDGARIDAD